jgi:U3 small nucleolar RNA-associated protein 23
MERRRCNHHTLEKPLPTLECLASVIDPKSSNTNKNRYVIASQEDEVRKFCRGVKGVPLVYVKRSVMVMEPMADSSVTVKEGIDRGKFRTGLRGQVNDTKRKRKRVDDFGHGDEQTAISATLGSNDGEEVDRPIKKKRTRGPKGPNPLSVKRPRKIEENSDKQSKAKIEDLKTSKCREEKSEQEITETVCVIEVLSDPEQNPSTRKKRKRKHKPPLLHTFRDNDLGPIQES